MARLLSLYNLGLTGTIPSTIGALTRLQYVAVAAQGCRRPAGAGVAGVAGFSSSRRGRQVVLACHGGGRYEPRVVSLVNRYIEFSANQLQGAIPDSVSALTAVVYVESDTSRPVPVCVCVCVFYNGLCLRSELFCSRGCSAAPWREGVPSGSESSEPRSVSVACLQLLWSEFQPTG